MNIDLSQIQANASTARNLSTLQKASGKVSEGKLAEIDATAKDFEAVFLSQMIGHMFEGIETDSTFGGGQAEDIYRSLMTDEYGKLISKSGGIGVADYVKREMLKMQEVGA